MTSTASVVTRTGAAAQGHRTPLGAWREVQATGDLPGDPDPDRTAAGLVSRWHQHLSVAMEVPLDRDAPGRDRLPQLVAAWLDLARRTERVRRQVARTSGPRTAAESVVREAQLVALLSEDLAALGAPEPGRSAQDLLRELTQIAAAEDAAGRPLPSQRRTVLGTGDHRSRCHSVVRLVRPRRLVTAAG